MSRSSGAGYPVWFMCPKLRRIWPRTSNDNRAHVTTPTGRVRKTRVTGKGHPRKSWWTMEYICACGHTGWSSHKDLEQAHKHVVLHDDDV